MMKFERVAINLQYESATVEEATNKFSHSCDICCSRGLHIDCDKCLIAEAHRLTVAAIEEVRKGK